MEMAAGPVPKDLPGRPLQSWVVGEKPDRNPIVFSEYHAQGLESGGYMVVRGDFKYNHYVGLPPQLFNIAEDPDELRDLSRDPAHEELLTELEERLRSVVDPEAADREAKSNQRKEGLARVY
jgi:choline-sulfatase